MRQMLWLLILVAPGLAPAADTLKRVPIAVISERPGASIDSPKYLPLCPLAVGIAIDERREEFAKLGLKIEPEVYYTDGGKLNTYHKVEEVLKGPAVGAVGLASSDEALVAGPLLQGSDLVVISPYATSGKLLELQPNLLQFAAPNEASARALETFAEQKFAPKRVVAVVAWDSGYSQNFYHSLSEKFRAKTKLIKVQDTIRNLQEVVKETLAEKPDLVVLPNFPVATAAVIKALVEGGYKGNFLGPDSWGEGTDPRFFLVLEKVPFTGYSVRQFSRFRLSPREQALKKRLNELSGLEYAILGVLYYDTTNYLLDRIKQAAPDVTRRKVLEFSKKARVFEGASGLQCLSTMECPQRLFSALRVKGAKFEYLEPVKAKATQVGR